MSNRFQRVCPWSFIQDFSLWADVPQSSGFFFTPSQLHESVVKLKVNGLSLYNPFCIHDMNFIVIVCIEKFTVVKNNNSIMFTCLHVSILANHLLQASRCYWMCCPKRGRYKNQWHFQTHICVVWEFVAELLTFDRVVANARICVEHSYCYAYSRRQGVKKAQNGIKLVSVHTPTWSTMCSHSVTYAFDFHLHVLNINVFIKRIVWVTSTVVAQIL